MIAYTVIAEYLHDDYPSDDQGPCWPVETVLYRAVDSAGLVSFLIDHKAENGVPAETFTFDSEAEARAKLAELTGG